MWRHKIGNGDFWPFFRKNFFCFVFDSWRKTEFILRLAHYLFKIKKKKGLSCNGNRKFWDKVQINQNHRIIASRQFNQNVPQFNSSFFLTSPDREAVDQMMIAGFRFFWSMIVVGCADNSTATYKSKIAEYLTSLLAWPSWADFADDSRTRYFYDPNGQIINPYDNKKISGDTFVFFKQKQFYVDLMSCK